MTPDDMTILFIEDDVLTRNTVTERLGRRGYDVLGAESGEQGLEMATALPSPNAVILDIDLPGIDGFETYRQLQVICPLARVIVCSAHLTQENKQLWLAMGLPEDRLISKPCPFGSLVAALGPAVAA
jgi:DNA-binding response OmpR family regulator